MKHVVTLVQMLLGDLDPALSCSSLSIWKIGMHFCTPSKPAFVGYIFSDYKCTFIFLVVFIQI